MGRALGPGQVVLGGNNMRDLRDQLVDESTGSHRRLSAAAHVSADSNSSSRSSGLDWEDFGVSALSTRGGLGNLSSAPSTRTSVRVSSVQMLAAALDAEKVSLAGGGSLSFGATTNSF